MQRRRPLCKGAAPIAAPRTGPEAVFIRSNLDPAQVAAQAHAGPGPQRGTAAGSTLFGAAPRLARLCWDRTQPDSRLDAFSETLVSRNPMARLFNCPSLAVMHLCRTSSSSWIAHIISAHSVDGRSALVNTARNWPRTCAFKPPAAPRMARRLPIPSPRMGRACRPSQTGTPPKTSLQMADGGGIGNQGYVS